MEVQVAKTPSLLSPSRCQHAYHHCLGPHRTQIRGNKLWAALCHDYRTNYSALAPRAFLEGTLQLLQFKCSRRRLETFSRKLKLYDKHGGKDGGREALLSLDVDYRAPPQVDKTVTADDETEEMTKLCALSPEPAHQNGDDLHHILTPSTRPLLDMVNSITSAPNYIAVAPNSSQSSPFSPSSKIDSEQGDFWFPSPCSNTLSSECREIFSTTPSGKENFLLPTPSAPEPNDQRVIEMHEQQGEVQKPLVLCLGLGVPLIPASNLRKKRLEVLKYSTDEATIQQLNSILNTEDPYKDALECVYFGVEGLPVIAARDFVRGYLTEQEANAVVFGVSMESGAQSHHPHKHLDANFNRTTSFLRALEQAMQKAKVDLRPTTKEAEQDNMRFSQAILDYFWIPDGSWQIAHWQPQFFSGTLVGLAERGLLSGKVYLPFTLHCFTQVLVAQTKLLRFYNVHFLRKEDLSEVALWKGTQTLDSQICQEVLGKHRQQEETECSFDMETINGFLYQAITKECVLWYARRLEDFGSIRFIVLETLPEGPNRTLALNGKRPTPPGQVMGLVSPDAVKNGIATYSMPKLPFNSRRMTTN